MIEKVYVAGERLLRISDVSEKTGLGRSTIYSYIGNERFPRPVQLSPGTVRWRESEIDAWIATLPRTGDDQN